MEDQEPITTLALEKKCRAHGLRMTGLRRCMLAILVESTGHLTPMEMFYRVSEKSMSTNVPSVYRNMMVFESIGIVRSHSFHTHQTYYELVGRPYDHLFNLHTGEIIQLKHESLDQFKADIARRYGYKIEACRIDFYAYPLNRGTTGAVKRD